MSQVADSQNQQAMNKVKEFREACKRVFNSEDGALVLKNLKEQYVDLTAIGESSEVTYYKLGQKEFVQNLIYCVSEDIDAEEKVEVTTNVSDTF